MSTTDNGPSNDNTLSDDEKDINPLQILKNLKIKNLNRLVIGHLNINSLRNKFESLKLLIKDNIDIMVITESKLDSTFPSEQFAIEGYNLPYRLDRDARSGGVIIYVREDIPCREFTNFNDVSNIEGIFLEINLRKTKWLLFGGYNPNKLNIGNFLGKLGPILDKHMYKFDNLLLLGDFNSEMQEFRMSEFCNMYNLINLIKVPTSFKNPLSPSSIDVILTNRMKSFQNNQAIETGLSDHHKMTITVLKSFFQKQAPVEINYRDYKLFDKSLFHIELENMLSDQDANGMSYELFESTFMELLNKHAPMNED